MKIAQSFNSYNFGRAFTTQEKKAYASLLKDSRKALDIKDTTAIVFDFNVPSKKGENTAIGTTWSESMDSFISFVKDMTGITSIQLQPQGKIVPGNKSPYSGTTFAYGSHIIDLSKLAKPEYGSLLSEQYVKDLDKKYPDGKRQREYRTNYDYIFPEFEKALNIAYSNFDSTNEEFVQFKKENENWLKGETLYVALSKLYGTDDYRKWNEIDANLFDSNLPNDVRNARIKEIESQFSEEIGFENFVQFIADKQQKESHKSLNEKDIEIYGDCLIGFSQSEMWAHKDCFRENLYYGGPDPNCPETNGIQTWGLPALDYTKLGECSEDGNISKLGATGKLLYDKYEQFFKRYDGVRVDAAWQFVTPFVYEAVNGNYNQVQLPEINMTIFNILKAAAKGRATSDNIMLELVGMSAGKSRDMTLNKYPHLYTTAYAEYDENPKKFMEKGYNRDNFYVGVGCHDNDSLVNLAKDDHKREIHSRDIFRNYGTSQEDFSVSGSDKYENFRNSKFAEIFSTAKQFFTLPDMFGMAQRINISGKKSPDNWAVRIPTDYERFYYSQLSNGYGLNMPKALAGGMLMNGFSSQNLLVKKCSEAAEILRAKGPLTEAEANEAYKKGEISNIFEYVS